MILQLSSVDTWSLIIALSCIFVWQIVWSIFLQCNYVGRFRVQMNHVFKNWSTRSFVWEVERPCSEKIVKYYDHRKLSSPSSHLRRVRTITVIAAHSCANLWPLLENIPLSWYYLENTRGYMLAFLLKEWGDHYLSENINHPLHEKMELIELSNFGNLMSPLNGARTKLIITVHTCNTVWNIIQSSFYNAIIWEISVEEERGAYGHGNVLHCFTYT